MATTAAGDAVVAVTLALSAIIVAAIGRAAPVSGVASADGVANRGLARVRTGHLTWLNDDSVER